MRSTNEYSFGKFCFMTWLLAMIIIRWYMGSMFINLKLGPLLLDTDMSANILIVFLTVFYGAGAVLTMDRNRTKFQLAANVLLPVEIYTVIAYFDVWPVFVRGFLAGTIIIAALYLFLYFKTRKKTGNGKKARRLRLRNAYLSVRVLAALTLSGLLIFPMLGFIQKPDPEEVREASTVYFSEDNEWTISQQSAVILTLQEDMWVNLNEKQRLKTLQTVVNIECVELGIPYMITVSARDLEGDVTGAYNHWERSIAIDEEYLQTGPAESSLETILHECRHAFQNVSVDLYEMCGEQYKNSPVFRDAVVWKEEFENYVSADGEDTFEDMVYYFQSCEEDSRNYAASRKTDYI